ncbi:MAG: AgmX/PglI C-terminal domain-containing protein, partial [Myxococcota bacterium]
VALGVGLAARPDAVSTTASDSAAPPTRSVVPPEVAPEAAPASIQMEVTAVAGRVTLRTPHERPRPLAVGDLLAPGASLHAQADAEAHLKMGAGTGFVLEPESRVVLVRADSEQVTLRLETGRVSNAVDPAGTETGYRVEAGPYEVRATGTRFAVGHDGGLVSVDLTRGSVDVLRSGRRVESMRAPAGWSSAPPHRSQPVRQPVALAEGSAEWPVLRLSTPKRVRSWELGDQTFDVAGGLAMRLPEGKADLVAIERTGRRIDLTLDVDSAGLALSEAEVGALLPEPVGHLDSEAISTTLRSIRPSLQGCYERAMRRRPDLHGRYRLEVKVGRSGTVQRSRMRSDDGDRPPNELTDCMSRVVHRRPFPEPTGGPVTFEVPLNFQRVSP